MQQTSWRAGCCSVYGLPRADPMFLQPSPWVRMDSFEISARRISGILCGLVCGPIQRTPLGRVGHCGPRCRYRSCSLLGPGSLWPLLWFCLSGPYCDCCQNVVVSIFRGGIECIYISTRGFVQLQWKPHIVQDGMN